MTDIAKIATDLGIKITSAKEASGIYKVWAHRVDRARIADAEIGYFAGRGEKWRAEAAARNKAAMIHEANLFASEANAAST